MPLTFEMTPAGKARLEAELEKLRDERRRLTESLKEAVRLGDLNENAEYHDTRHQAGMVTGRIQELEAILANAVLVEVEEAPEGVVGIGRTVLLGDLTNGEHIQYTIVSPFEAEPLKGRISSESPLAAAILGAQVDDEVEAQVPSGTLRLRILEVC